MSKLIVFLWLQGYSYSEGSATGSLIAASVIAADGIQAATRMRQGLRCFLFTLRAGRTSSASGQSDSQVVYSSLHHGSETNISDILDTLDMPC